MIKVLWLGTPQLESQHIVKVLEQLGYTPYHIFEVIRQKEHREEWKSAMLSRKPLNTAIMQGYDAALLTPMTPFYKEMLRANPEMKFILSEMDSTKAYKRFRSVKRLIRLNSWWASLFKRTRDIMEFVKLDALNATKSSRNSLEFQVAYNEMVNEIKANVPSNQLLIYHESDGWKPLCDFLGVPIPSKTKMPKEFAKFRSEANRNIWQMTRAEIGENLIYVVLYVITLVAILLYLVFFYQ